MLRSAALALSVACITTSALAQKDDGGIAGGVEPLSSVEVAFGLVRPVFATHAPGDTNRLYILEKHGRIRILNLKTGVLQASNAPFLEINAIVGGGSSNGDERGLLGLAFHPDYPATNEFFVYYTNNSNDTVVSQYNTTSPDLADAGSGNIVMVMDQPFTNHNGGWIGFGPNDGYLYIATGDGGSACDPGQRAQDITNQLLGKMLRIDVDAGDQDYAIPPDNPFVGVTGDDEIWAYGLRNPWRCSFDSANGDLYIADVGQGQREEIDLQPADSLGGENYGWDCMEGNSCASISGCGAGACVCNSGSLTDPITQYTHSSGCSVTGGYVYRGCAIPTLHGHYFYADYCSSQIWSFRYDGGVQDFAVRTSELAPGGGNSINSISSFGEDARGEMYICDQAGGEVFKIIPDAGELVPEDVNCDRAVDVQDLTEVILSWGECMGCAADVNGDDVVNVEDLTAVILAWG